MCLMGTVLQSAAAQQAIAPPATPPRAIAPPATPPLSAAPLAAFPPMAWQNIEVLATPYLWLPWVSSTVRPSNTAIPSASASSTTDPDTIYGHLTWIPFTGSVQPIKQPIFITGLSRQARRFCTDCPRWTRAEQPGPAGMAGDPRHRRGRFELLPKLNSRASFCSSLFQILTGWAGVWKLRGIETSWFASSNRYGAREVQSVSY